MTRLLTFILLSLPLIGAYAIFGLGIVVIYRASRVLNLAHGAMAMVSAYLVYSMVSAGIPMILAFILGVVAGGLMGIGIERTFVRPLRRVSTTAQTVGTVAALGIIVSVAGKIWGTGSLPAPRVFPDGQIAIGESAIRYGEIGLFGVMLLVAMGLFALLQYTDVGLAMRGSADNRRAASLMGIDPDVATSGAWLLGGVTAAIAGILLAAVTNLHPLVLSLQAVPAFVAVLLGGLESLPGALIGAAVVGVTQALVPAFDFLQKIEGGPQMLLAILALAVMAMRGERLVAGDIRKSEL
jgi:branched-chain amino acid transport system permease protein